MTSAPAFLSRQKLQLLGVGAAGVVIAGAFAQDPAAYLCIAIPAMLPLFLWLRAEARGMPVLPIICSLLFVYYAVPILRHEINFADSDDIFAAAVTVAAFLGASSLACWPFYLHMPRRSPDYGRIFASDRPLMQLALIGIACGIAYHLAVISGSLDWLGASTGLVRSLAVTLASIACYLVGYARASRQLSGIAWALALSGVLLLIILAWTNLLLSGGLIYSAAALLGYVITTKRIPWFAVGMIFASLAVLQAGKYEVRDQYWSIESSSLKDGSLAQVPAMMADWLTAGFEAILSTGKESRSDFLERASLLHMVLLVQRETPDFLPYLGGKTYALLPSMMMPRFLAEDKTISQAGLNLLSVYYGLQLQESTANTTIGWGLIAEGYANFGLWGVIVVGAIFGALCGAITRFSAGAAANSLPMFVAIPATLALMDVEADFSYLVVTLGQAVVATILLVGPFTFLHRPSAYLRRPREPDRRPAEDISLAE